MLIPCACVFSMHIFYICTANSPELYTTPQKNRWYRCPKSKLGSYTMTPYQLLCLFAILSPNHTHFGDKSQFLWTKTTIFEHTIWYTKLRNHFMITFTWLYILWEISGCSQELFRYAAGKKTTISLTGFHRCELSHGNLNYYREFM